MSPIGFLRGNSTAIHLATLLITTDHLWYSRDALSSCHEPPTSDLRPPVKMELDFPEILLNHGNLTPPEFEAEYGYPRYLIFQGDLSDDASPTDENELPSVPSVNIAAASTNSPDIEMADASSIVSSSVSALDVTASSDSITAFDTPVSSDNITAVGTPVSSDNSATQVLPVTTENGTIISTTADGKKHFKFPSLPPNNLQRPVTLLNLPQEVHKKLYGYVLGPTTSVSIWKISNLPADSSVHPDPNGPEYSVPAIALQSSIESPTNLFLVSRTVHSDAAAVLYGRIKFVLEHPWGIGFMTGNFGLDNCKKILHLKVHLEHIPDITLTISTVFPKIQTLQVQPSKEWYAFWKKYLYDQHNGNADSAVFSLVRMTRASGVHGGIGLREIADISRNLRVKAIVVLKYWNNGLNPYAPIVTVSLNTIEGEIC